MPRISTEGMLRQISRWLDEMRRSRYRHADRVVFATVLLHQVLREMPKRDRAGAIGLVLNMISEEYPDAGVQASAALFPNTPRHSPFSTTSRATGRRATSPRSANPPPPIVL
jgi:hypothetical protein